MAADEAEILSIAIAASHRGRGLSRDLLLTHLGHLAGRGVRTIFLEVEENNQPARRLYERAGFTVVGRRERYYQQAERGTIERPSDAPRLVVTPGGGTASWQKAPTSNGQIGTAIDQAPEGIRRIHAYQGKP